MTYPEQNLINTPFSPENFGFSLRTDYQMPEIAFFEKNFPGIEQGQKKDWQRLNLYLSKSGDFICIWYGVIDTILADMAYEEEFGFNWEDHNRNENLFRGYIFNAFEADIILKAVRADIYGPQYLGPPKPA